MAASTASKNSRPRCSRRSSYHRPARRYSTSASSSNRTRGFTACAGQLPRVVGRLPMPDRPIPQPSPGAPAVRFRPPRRLQLRQGSRVRRHPDWRATQRRHRPVRRWATSALPEEVLALVKSCGHSTPERSSPTSRWSRRRRWMPSAAAQRERWQEAHWSTYSSGGILSSCWPAFIFAQFAVSSARCASTETPALPDREGRRARSARAIHRCRRGLSAVT